MFPALWGSRETQKHVFFTFKNGRLSCSSLVFQHNGQRDQRSRRKLTGKLEKVNTKSEIDREPM